MSVTDGDGRPRPVETDSEDDVLRITSRADDFVHGRQTYVFTYTLENVVRHFSDTAADEFYWDVNGTEWQQQFGRVTARVTMPADIARDRRVSRRATSAIRARRTPARS